MPISNVHSNFGGNNRGSSQALVEYLDKENKELFREAAKEPNKEKQAGTRNRRQDFFSAGSDRISKQKVREDIDSNNSKLGKKDAKFFAPTINFSKAELEHLSRRSTKNGQIKKVREMDRQELGKFNAQLHSYTRKVMDNYARNFNRQSKGLHTGNDLVYYAKIEHRRRYKGTDKDVKEGKAKSGRLKPGLQSHIHIIVSRKDRSQRLKLDPLAKEKKTDRIIGKNRYRVGFDRKNWIISNEKSFDKMFGFQRKREQGFTFQNRLKKQMRLGKVEVLSRNKGLTKKKGKGL